MTRWKHRWAMVAGIAATAGAAACGGTDQSPLGGPYGGEIVVPGPTEGSGSAAGSSGGGTSAGSSAAADAGAGAQGATSGGSGSSTGSGAASAAGPTPTWTQIYDSYLASGTEGHCASCHGETGSASGTYAFLQGRGYISGASTSLACLSWFGGNMPPAGPPSDPQATAAIDAWAAAGAPNN